MKNVELNKLLNTIGMEELDEEIIGVLNLLRTNTPIQEQRIARVLFTAHLIESEPEAIQD